MTPTEYENNEAQIRAVVDGYLVDVFGPNYTTGRYQKRDGRGRFMVLYQPEDIDVAFAIGGVSVDAVTSQIEELTHEQIRNMKEAAAVRAAQQRGEMARDESGHILRYHARVQSNAWISNRVDLKVGTTGGIFIPAEPPIWRFSIHLHADGVELGPLDVIDVHAKTGQVIPLTEQQLELIRGGVRALRRHPELAAAA